jgi:small subunit ribosomal protein S18
MAEETKKKKAEEIESEVEEKERSSEPSRRRTRRRRLPQNLKCPLCESGTKEINYKEIYQLKKYTSVRGKIISTEKSGVCTKHQRRITRAIKRARYMALLPYSSDE